MKHISACIFSAVKHSFREFKNRLPTPHKPPPFNTHSSQTPTPLYPLLTTHTPTPYILLILIYPTPHKPPFLYTHPHPSHTPTSFYTPPPLTNSHFFIHTPTLHKPPLLYTHPHPPHTPLTQTHSSDIPALISQLYPSPISTPNITQPILTPTLLTHPIITPIPNTPSPHTPLHTHPTTLTPTTITLITIIPSIHTSSLIHHHLIYRTLHEPNSPHPT